MTVVRMDHGGDDEDDREAAENHACSENCLELHSLSLSAESGLVCKLGRS
jgi:hypothetical protein